MTVSNKQKIYELLKSIETGDTAAVAAVNEDKYIQHNPQTHEGSEGLAVLFKRLSKSHPKVNIVRIFEDADFVFAHTEYDFANRNIGFEIFRFEDGQAVEHWDNIQPRLGPNPSEHTMVDGETEVVDHDKTNSNRKLVQKFIQNVLIKGQFQKLPEYINQKEYSEHNPRLNDDMAGLLSLLSKPIESPSITYRKCHRVLAEGNFVLSVCEGEVKQTTSSFFDLYRIKANKIIEHWDTTEAIPLRSEWKNTNGKF